jgi:hypothetical protein
MGVVVTERVLEEELGCMLVERFLNGFRVHDKTGIFDGPFPMVRVPLEGCPVPLSSGKLDQ